ncbi:MAG: DUF6527 family protein [Bdellovibrionales bacterium]|nr:DUF6527 family protein [Bdellovibrionales bacterium]
MTIVNLLERLRKYRTEWVEDLPKRICKNTIYIIGGREHPFYAAVTCPRKKCKKVIHLEISKQFEKRWSVKKEENGSISLYPSIHVIDSPCGCHYWVQKGHIVWHSLPPIIIPKSNRVTQ